jgi:nucleoside-diphosphate-sugar epimerase
MIVGNGLIASALKDADNVTYFAAGVSNSSETKVTEFEREAQLLKAMPETNTLVYFSTTPKNNSPYMEHKRRMEALVRANFKQHIILRVQYICGNGGNDTNIFNYLKRKIKAKELLTLYNLDRALLDVEDLARIVEHCNYGTHTLNGIEPLPIYKIAEMIAFEYNIGLNYCLKNVTEQIATNDSSMDAIIDKLGINRNGYTKRLVHKYC